MHFPSVLKIGAVTQGAAITGCCGRRCAAVRVWRALCDCAAPLRTKIEAQLAGVVAGGTLRRWHALSRYKLGARSRETPFCWRRPARVSISLKIMNNAGASSNSSFASWKKSTRRKKPRERTFSLHKTRCQGNCKPTDGCLARRWPCAWWAPSWCSAPRP